MQLKLKTTTLKEMTSRAIKGSGNNKLLPLTELLCIKANNGQLVMETTDGTNYLYIISGDLEQMDPDFYVTIKSDQFGKLISKLTCDSVTMVISANALEIRGNGTYRLTIPMDEEGDVITYPDPYSKLSLNGNPKQINLTTIQSVIKTCQSSLAQTLEIPCYTGYYFGDKVIATDSNKIAGMNIKVFDENILVPPEVLNLVNIMTSEKIDFTKQDSSLIFTSPDCIVIGQEMEGIEEYPVTQVSALLEQDMDSKCSISKTEILSLLERISLFVGPYDDHAIRFTFTSEGLNIESMQSTGVETINYLTSDNFKPFTCSVDITYLLSELKAISGDSVQMQYGADNALRFDEGNTTIIIALLTDTPSTEE